MRLQDVLKEREDEIAHLEQSLKEKENTVSPTAASSQVFDSEESSSPVNMESYLSPGSANGDGPFLSPGTLDKFNQLKSTMTNGHGRTDSLTTSEADESLERLNELMRCARLYIPGTIELTDFHA